MRREERKSEEGVPAPPHQSELNEAARSKPQTRWKIKRKSMLGRPSPVANPPNNKIIVHGKGIFLQMKWCKIRLSGKKQEYEHRDSWKPTVEGVWCKREAGRGLMENDKEGEPGYAGRTWVGHIGNTGFWGGLVSGWSVRGVAQRGLAP